MGRVFASSVLALAAVAATGVGCNGLLGDFDGAAGGDDAGTDAPLLPDAPRDDGAVADSRVESGAPGFDLTFAAPRVALVRSTAASIGVTVARRGGFADAVVISVTGLPSGVTIDPLTIAAGSSTGTLTFHTAATAILGTRASAAVSGASGTVTANKPLTLFVQDPSGTVDTTFGTGGKAIVPLGTSTNRIGGQGVVVQSDGNILLCGNVTAGNTSLAVARLKTDGTLDQTFAARGMLVMNSPGHTLDVCAAVTPLPGGGVAIGGFTLLPTTGAPHAFLAAKFTAAGAPDTTFNGNGFVATDVGGGDSKAQALALQPDGKLVFGGFGPGGSALLRLGADGRPDTTFGPNATGFVITTFTGTGAVTGLGLRSDGKVLAGIQFSSLFAFRYSPLGVLDAAYGTAGHATAAAGALQIGDASGQLVVQPDDKIVISGFVTGPPGTIQLARFTDLGQLDTTFGASGIVTTRIPAGDASSRALALAPDGSIAVAASIPTTTGASFGVARYTSAGVLDTTFATIGYTATNVGTASLAQAVTVDSDGRILVAGVASDGIRLNGIVVRYWP